MGDWRKSTYSDANGGNCVEVGTASGVLVRDTKDEGQGPVLRVTAADWRRFTAAVK
jgi:hypothetical protein